MGISLRRSTSQSVYSNLCSCISDLATEIDCRRQRGRTPHFIGSSSLALLLDGGAVGEYRRLVETSMLGCSKVTCYCCCSASCSSSRNFFIIFAFLTRNWIQTKLSRPSFILVQLEREKPYPFQKSQRNGRLQYKKLRRHDLKMVRPPTGSMPCSQACTGQNSAPSRAFAPARSLESIPTFTCFLPFLSSSYAKVSESSNSFLDAEAFLLPPSLLLSLLIKMWADDDFD
ncbi:hypothetical protein VNO80_17388 [Phaseolus coccineus]|uniref:Uncharacterized protein n=1 Tax=Phaseolus coccineus TaxID=3886 RepID=A0AAN9MCB2_PHACN